MKKICSIKYLIKCLRIRGYKASYSNLVCGFFLNGSKDYFYFVDKKNAEIFKCSFLHYPILSDLQVRSCNA